MRRVVEHYGDDARQFGEWFLPEVDGAPLVVTIHGGYFRPVWHLDLEEASALDLAAHGFAVWSIEYRAYDHPWPSTLLDVAAAIDHGLAAAQEHGVDITRRALLGHSAGGALAAWTTSRRALPTHAPGADVAAPTFTLVVLHAPVACLTTGSREGLGQGAIDTFLGGRPEEVPDRYAVTDPCLLTPDLVGRRVLLHGDADEDVPVSQSEAYFEHLLDHGVDAELTVIPGDTHYEILDPTSTTSVLRRDLLTETLRPGAQ